MRVLKNILIGLGVLLLVMLAFFTWMEVSSGQFRKEQAPFVTTFVTDLSRRWDMVDVTDRLTNSFIEQTGTPQARQLLQQFKQLGVLKSVRDLELLSYFATTRGRTGVFGFKGTFENGEALVHVTIVKQDGTVRVTGFYLNGTHTRDRASKLQT